MDGQAQSISSQQLYQNLGTASAPILVDVSRQDAFGNDDRLIIGALRRPPGRGRALAKGIFRQPALAISYGVSANFPDDHEMLKHGMIMYDALYTWCRQQVARQSQLKVTA